MTEKDIQQIVGKDRVLAGHPIVCHNVNSLLVGQQDMISVNGRGMLIEYEIKISRADFKRDAKKGKGETFTSLVRNLSSFMPEPCDVDRVPNQFYYVVPAGLIGGNEVPNYAGLIEIANDKMAIMITAPFIHKVKHDALKILKKVTTLYQQRQYLGCCLLTYNNKKHRQS